MIWLYVDGYQRVECSGLNKYDPKASYFECLVMRECHYLEYIRRSGFCRVGLAFLEEVCYGGMVKDPRQAQFLSLLLSAGPDFTATSLALCLSACCHVFCHDENGINIWNCIWDSIKYFLLLEFLWSRCLFTVQEHLLRESSNLCIFIKKFIFKRARKGILWDSREERERARGKIILKSEK